MSMDDDMKSQFVPMGHMPQVLLVDDNPNNRRIVLAMLKRLGIKPVIAVDGVSAVEEFAKQSFALILMDVHMPNMDGMEASRRIREIEKLDGRELTPIMAVTANALPEDWDACEAAGMVMAKPVCGEPFFSAVDQWLQPGGDEPVAVQELVMDWSVLEQLGQDVVIEVIPALISNFGEDLATSNNKIDALLAVNKLEDLTRLAHTLKGLAATFGANQLAKAVERVENSRASWRYGDGACEP